jgi:glycerol 2-dehydrogenase (NADP+)
MEKLLQTGKVRAIGVANFDIHNLEVLRNCPGLSVTPAVNQVELHPYLQQKKLKEYCDGKGIHVTAYSPYVPLGGVDVSPTDWLNRLGSTGSTLKTEQAVHKIAEKHQCDIGAVLVDWGVQSGHSVLPKVSEVVWHL